MKTTFWIATLLLSAVQSWSVAAVPLDAWQAAVVEKVAEQKTTPRSAVLRKSKGEVRMNVAVDGNGMITNYEMVQSSGEPILDREADLIMLRVGSFPAPPDRRSVQLIVPIRW